MCESAFAKIRNDFGLPRDVAIADRGQLFVGRCSAAMIIAARPACVSGDAQSFEAGMNDFLVKPIAPDQFFSTLLKWLERDTRPL